MGSPKFWPNRFLPEGFILETKVIPGYEVPVAGSSSTFLNATEDIRSARLEWEWRNYSKLWFDAEPEEGFRAMIQHFEAQPEHIWMTMGSLSYGEATQEWVLVEGSIAAMIAYDAYRQGSEENFFDFDAILMISNRGTILSFGGLYTENAIWMSEPLSRRAKAFSWPDWAKLIFKRHPDLIHLQECFFRPRWENTQEISFYLFCSHPWSSYVLSEFECGDAASVTYVVNTMHMLDRIQEGQGITIWDDLALAWYADDPPDWAARIPQFININNLCPDMVDQKGLEQLKRKIAGRKLRNPRG